MPTLYNSPWIPVTSRTVSMGCFLNSSGLSFAPVLHRLARRLTAPKLIAGVAGCRAQTLAEAKRGFPASPRLGSWWLCSHILDAPLNRSTIPVGFAVIWVGVSRLFDFQARSARAVSKLVHSRLRPFTQANSRGKSKTLCHYQSKWCGSALRQARLQGRAGSERGMARCLAVVDAR